jgi:hypothetical protein
LNSPLLVDAAAVVDEVSLGALRQAQIFVGLLFDLGELSAERLEIVS